MAFLNRKESMVTGLLAALILFVGTLFYSTIKGDITDTNDDPSETEGLGIGESGYPASLLSEATAPTDDLLDFSNLIDEQMSLAEIEAQKELNRLNFEAKYKGNPERFVKLNWDHGINYEFVSAALSEDDAPELRRMLADPLYAQDWSSIVAILSFVDPSEQTADALLTHLKNPFDFTPFVEDDPDSIGSTVISSKVSVLGVLGRMNLPGYDSILANALSEEGAQTLAQEWLDVPMPKSVERSGGRTFALDSLRTGAAMGLVLSRNPTNIQLVKDLYQREKSAGTEFVNHVIDALVLNDFIEDVGMEESMKASSQANLYGRLIKYLVKYQ